jgi:hypothetical protein
MIIIEIVNGIAKEQEFQYKAESNNAKPGETGAFIRQHCLVHGHYVNGFRATQPRDSAITLGIINKTRGAAAPKPYALGKYVVSPECFYFDREELAFGRVRLQPLQEFLQELNEQITALEGKKAA